MIYCTWLADSSTWWTALSVILKTSNRSFCTDVELKYSLSMKSSIEIETNWNEHECTQVLCDAFLIVFIEPKIYNSNSSYNIYSMDGVWSVLLLSLFQKGRILQKNIHLIAIYYRLLTFQWAFIVVLFCWLEHFCQIETFETINISLPSIFQSHNFKIMAKFIGWKRNKFVEMSDQ